MVAVFTMPISKFNIGKDIEGRDVNVVWGDKLNWAHGIVDSRGERREYYRAQGRNNAHYAVIRDIKDKFDGKGNSIFAYWYVVMHIDGITNNLPIKFMNAYEGQEVCQIFESERAHDISRAYDILKERARAHVEETKKLTGGRDDET